MVEKVGADEGIPIEGVHVVGPMWQAGCSDCRFMGDTWESSEQAEAEAADHHCIGDDPEGFLRELQSLADLGDSDVVIERLLELD